MKKFGLFLMCAFFALSGLNAEAVDNGEDNGYGGDPAPINIREDSILVVMDQDGKNTFELTVPTELGYQEIVFPYGTDLANLTFRLDYEKIQFSIDDEVKAAHNLQDEWLEVDKGFYDYIRKNDLDRIAKYSEGDSGCIYLVNGGITLKDGETYTISLEGTEQYAVVKNETKDYCDKSYYFNIQQGRKFAFKVRVAGPPVLEGETLEVTKGAEAECSVRVDKEFSSFKGATCNGKLLVKDKDYTAKSGSTIVTLSAEYLKTLEPGEYTIKVLFDDCESEPATLKIVSKGAADDGTDNSETGNKDTSDTDKNKNDTDKIIDNGKTGNPKTGDYKTPEIWLAIIAGMVLMVGFAAKKRKI